MYEDAGHVITIPYEPTSYQHYGGELWLGGTPRGTAMAGADAWPRTVEFFEDHLG